MSSSAVEAAPLQEIMCEFRAGRMSFEGKQVVPDNRKGLIRVGRGEEGLIHFQWLDRTQSIVELDQIVFPDEAVFEKVTQSSGRVYILKFSSDDRKFFFWMQEPHPAGDTQICHSVNCFINHPIDMIGDDEAEASVPMHMSEVSEDTADDDLSSRCQILGNVKRGPCHLYELSCRGLTLLGAELSSCMESSKWAFHIDIWAMYTPKLVTHWLWMLTLLIVA